MPLFICEDCHAIENTALGVYHGVYGGLNTWFPKEYQGRVLCSECASPAFSDGTATPYGKWHGQFDKTIVTLESLQARIDKEKDNGERMSNFVDLGPFKDQIKDWKGWG